jgi:hypothetical protein
MYCEKELNQSGNNFRLLRECFTVISDVVFFFYTKTLTVYDEGIKTTEFSFM